jgi:hypothetical protein
MAGNAKRYCGLHTCNSPKTCGFLYCLYFWFEGNRLTRWGFGIRGIPFYSEIGLKRKAADFESSLLLFFLKFL